MDTQEIEKDKYIMERAQTIRLQADNVKRNLDNIDNLIHLRKNNLLLKTNEKLEKKKINKDTLEIYVMIFSFFIFLSITSLYYYRYIDKDFFQNFYKVDKNKIHDETPQKIKHLIIDKIVKILNSKYLLLATISHNLLKVIITQCYHIKKLENIIKILVS